MTLHCLGALPCVCLPLLSGRGLVAVAQGLDTWAGGFVSVERCAAYSRLPCPETPWQELKYPFPRTCFWRASERCCRELTQLGFAGDRAPVCQEIVFSPCLVSMVFHKLSRAVRVHICHLNDSFVRESLYIHHANFCLCSR